MGEIVSLSNAVEEWRNEWHLIKDIFADKYPLKQLSLELSWLEKVFMSTLVLIRIFSLSHLKNLFTKDRHKSDFVEAYIVFWYMLMLTLLFTRPICKNFIAIIVIYRIVDSFNYNMCVLFVDRHSSKWKLRSLNRSLLLLLINYSELIIGFAILYSLSKSVGKMTAGVATAIYLPVDVLYYSLVTITTLGFGDWVPINSVGRLLSMTETTLGLILLIVVFGTFLTGVNIKDIIDNN